jgi:hypothetical protein
MNDYERTDDTSLLVFGLNSRKVTLIESDCSRDWVFSCGVLSSGQAEEMTDSQITTKSEKKRRHS